MEILLSVAGYIILPTTIWFFGLGKFFGLNTDVIETNVLNQGAVVIIVIVFIGGAFRDTLNLRLKEVIETENTTFRTSRQYWSIYAASDERHKKVKGQKIDSKRYRFKYFIKEKKFKFKRLYKKLGRILIRGRKRQVTSIRQTCQRIITSVGDDTLTFVSQRIRQDLLTGSVRREKQIQLSNLYIQNTIFQLNGWLSKDIALREITASKN
jgi:hypothetical protein